MSTMILRQEVFGGLLFSTDTGEVLQLNRSAYACLYSIALGYSGIGHIDQVGSLLGLEPSRAREIVECFERAQVVPIRGRSLRVFSEFAPAVWSEPSNYLTAPESVTIRLWSMCNMTCTWCYVDQGNSRAIPEDVVAAILQECGNLGVCRVNFGGGEPFLLPARLGRYAQYAQDHGMFVSVTTNGTLLSPHVVESACDSGVGHIQLSVGNQGDCADGNGIGSGAATALRVLTEVGATFGVSILLDAERIGSLPAIVEEAFRLGAKSAKLLRPKPSLSGPGRGWFENHRMERVERATWIEIIDGLMRDYPISLCCGLAPLASSLPGSDPCIGCLAATRSMSVDCDGNAYPCPFFTGLREQCVGSVYDHSVGLLWTDSPVMRRFREERALAEGNLDADGFPTKQYGCRFVALMDTGDLSGQDLLASRPWEQGAKYVGQAARKGVLGDSCELSQRGGTRV